MKVVPGTLQRIPKPHGKGCRPRSLCRCHFLFGDPVWDRTIRILSTGSAVVWNPSAVTTAAMADLADEGYQAMRCVETTNAGTDVVSVEAGGERRLSAEYRLVNP